MKTLLLAAGVFIAIPAASAQTVNAARQVQNASSPSSYSLYAPAGAWRAQQAEPLECLSVKASRQTVCHTREEWAQIAKRIEQRLPWR